MDSGVRCRRVKAGEYEIYAAAGVKIGSAVLTGRYGADDYPWDWSCSRPDGWPIDGGSVSTLREARGKITETLRRTS